MKSSGRFVPVHASGPAARWSAVSIERLSSRMTSGSGPPTIQSLETLLKMPDLRRGGVAVYSRWFWISSHHGWWMKKKLYLRCNGGHYFLGAVCPFDGWTLDGAVDLVDHAIRLDGSGELSLASLVAGVKPSPELLRRVLIIEFGADSAVYEALVPERYLVDGREVLWRDTGDGLN